MRIFKSCLAVLFLIYTFTLAAQPWKFDGNNCDSSIGSSTPFDEWGTPLVVDGVDPINGSSDIINFWASSDKDYFYIACNRVSKGNSGFSFFLDVDCDNSTGDVSKQGADYAFFFNVSSGVVSNTTLYEWRTANYAQTGRTFDAILGQSICGDNTTDEQFFEMRFLLSEIFDLCDTAMAVCGFITVEVGSTTAVGSPNSAVKDNFIVNIPFGINLPPVASIGLLDTIACNGDEVVLNGNLSVDGNSTLSSIDSITLYEWDFNYNGVTFNPTSTGINNTVSFTTNDTTKIALRVTDLYSCVSIDSSTIYSFVRPMANGQISYSSLPDPNCRLMNYDGKASDDNSGANNLSYFWDFGDASSSILDSDIYPNCLIYNVVFSVNDPDNPLKCRSHSQFFIAALPVEMISFVAKKHNETEIALQWATSSETNNRGWEVYNSMDGVNWTSLGFHEGAEFSNSINEYEWIDRFPKVGVNFYKLKQIDFDGRFIFSKIETLNYGTLNENFIIYPNPVKDELFVEKTGKSELPTVVDIYTQSGQLMSSYTLEGLTKRQFIDMSNFESGVYYARIKTIESIFNHRFVVVPK